MAESKKHSRKSKLVPRECIEIEDERSSELEEAVLSIPVFEPSTSLLPKIKDSINKDSFKVNDSRNLSVEVQIEVESCSDDERIESSVVYNDDEEKYLEEHEQLLSKLPQNEIVISSEEILEEVENTAKKITSVTDKQLDIYIRNCLGRYIKIHEPDYYEKAIQDILAHWRVWVCLSKLRSYILAFKCNICCLGWWRLGPFAEHIRIHKTVRLQMETFHHDCVITAASGEWFENMCQPKIDGNCPQCLKSYEHHKKQKYINSLFYLCDACGDRFSTCKSLFSHEGMCTKYERFMYENSKIHGEWHCTICDTNCLSKERYEEHFQEYHDVRSDEPIVSQNVPKECGTCGVKYFVFNLHLCPKKQDKFKCSHCCRKFPNKFMVDMHENCYNGHCYCPVCNKHMKKQCMLFEHLLRHTKYYTMALKCQECSDHVLVTSHKLMAKHKLKYHFSRKQDRRSLEQLIVPIKCLTQGADFAAVTDMALERRNRHQKSQESKEMLETLAQIMQTPEKCEVMDEKEKELAEIQEKHMKHVENVSKQLADKFLKRAKGVKDETETNYDAEVQMAVDSLKFDANDTNTNDKTNVNDDSDDDNDLKIDDDDINETESSVNALLLNQFNIKQDIDIDEPDLPHYMVVQDSNQRNSRDSDDSKQSGILFKKELLCEEEFAMDGLEGIVIKKETREPQLTIVENSQESYIDEVEILTESETKSIKVEVSSEVPEIDEDCIEVNVPEPELIVIDDSDDDNDVALPEVPENRQTIVSKGNENILETHVTIKQESLDGDEFKAEVSNKNVTAANDIKTNTTDVKETAKKNDSEYIEVKVKEEEGNYEEFDDEIENEILKEQEACLEELSKVFQATKNSKKVELSNICVDEVNVKNEPMDVDEIIEDEIFEDDIIVMNRDPTFFKLKDTSEALKSSFSDKSSDEINNTAVNPSHLEPKISLTENNSEPSSSEMQTNKKIYRCRRCKFVGEHKVYAVHKKITCPFLPKSQKKMPKEIWSDIRCTHCDYSFPTLRKYYLHLCNIHDLNTYCCPQCPIVFKTMSQTLIHFIAHIKKTYIKLQVLKEVEYVSSLSKGVYQCKICAKEVAFNDFFYHWESHLVLNFEGDHKEQIDTDEEEKKLVIDEGDCKITVKQEDVKPRNPDYALPQQDIKKLLDQLQFPSEGRCKSIKKCCLCNRRFERRNDVKRHVIEHLLKSAYSTRCNGLQCQLCGKSFDKADNYKVHMRHHGSLPLFKCEMCNKCFSDSSNFAKHKKVHNLQALVCDNCGKKFQSKRQLEKHMELHRSTKPLQCNICNRVFSLPPFYRKHMRTMHGPRNSVSYCQICRKREFTKRELWDHMWQVHKIRLYRADCLICDKSFRKYVEVRQHMRLAHHLNSNVKIKTLKLLQELSAEERAEKIRALVNSTVCISKPGSDETFVISES